MLTRSTGKGELQVGIVTCSLDQDLVLVRNLNFKPEGLQFFQQLGIELIICDGHWRIRMLIVAMGQRGVERSRLRVKLLKASQILRNGTPEIVLVGGDL
jgi:hypothetical protein